MKLGLILTAAGLGARFGTPVPKVLERIHGRTVLEHSLLAFRPFEDIVTCVVTCPELFVSDYKTLLKEHSFPFSIKCIVGATTRAESVQKAFEELDPVDRVLIHDAARPCVSSTLIERVIDSLMVHDVVIPGLPVTDTIKRMDSNYVKETVDRSDLISVQTPQGFSCETLRSLYSTTSLSNITDESMLAEYSRIPIYSVPGERRNIKLTYPDDLDLVSFYCTAE